MVTRKTLSLVGLMFAVAALSPAAALGEAGGANRPTKLTSSGLVTRYLQPGTWVSDTTGKMSHLGKIALHAEGTFAPAGSAVAISGTTTTVAANGDELYGTLEGTSAHLSPAGEISATFKVTVTGGTGRLKHAHGTLNVEEQGILVSLDATSLVTQDQFVGQGKISYPVCGKAIKKVEKAQKQLENASGKKAEKRAKKRLRKAKKEKKKAC